MKEQKHDIDIAGILAETDVVFNVDNSFSAIFTEQNRVRYREEEDMPPITVGKKGRKFDIIRWGLDNNLPYNILTKIEQDETVSSCQTFNAEILFGGGVEYDTENCSTDTKAMIEEFFEENSIASAWLGCCQDIKHYAFSVVIISMNADNSRIVAIERKEACNIRFEKADSNGVIQHVLYANWRNQSNPTFEVYPLLDQRRPLADIRERAKSGSVHNFAMLVRIPSVDMMYYPIPYYGSVFTSRWYNIKRSIAIAKEAKITNSAPLKYHIEVTAKYWDRLVRDSGLSDKKEIRELINKRKQEIVKYLTGVQNSGKAIFTQFAMTPDGKEEHEIKITNIEGGKQGGDWEQDLSEAVNIICFAMGVHSNLVGSVPGKSQTNNSGSDKRELYTIAQLRQKPYHDLMFQPFRLIASYNGWKNAKPRCPLLMLTTLDEHKDVKPITQE